MAGKITFIVLAFLHSGIPNADDSADWLTGRHLDRQCLLAINGRWADTPLGPLLFELASDRRIAVFVDRRIDPGTKVTLEAKDLTWDQLLLSLGAGHQFGFVQLENVFYFGPQTACVRLGTEYRRLAGELRARQKQLERNWLSPIGVNWPRFTEPRQKLDSLGSDIGITVVNPDEVPHDLWPEFRSPKMSPLLQALLLVQGFEKSIAISTRGTKLKIVDEPNLRQARYTVQHVSEARSMARNLQPGFPEVELIPDGDSSLEIRGPIASLTPVIAHLIAQQQPIRAASENVRFTVELRGTRESILATMAHQLDVELNCDSQWSEVLSEFKKLQFENATAEEIISAALDGTGLGFHISKTELTIVK